MRLVQFSSKTNSVLRVGAQLGQDGDILDLTNSLDVGSALEFIESGSEGLAKALKYVLTQSTSNYLTSLGFKNVLLYP